MDLRMISMNRLHVDPLPSGAWRVYGDRLGPMGHPLTATALELLPAIERYLSGDYDPVQVTIEPNPQRRNP